MNTFFLVMQKILSADLPIAMLMMTAEMVGMEKFPIALGLVYASPGVTMMLGPVLCGTIKSVTVITGYTTGYDVAYYFSAVMMVLSSFMAVFLKNMKV